jgi:hypothetical protein
MQRFSSSKPKQKAQGHSDLTQIVARGWLLSWENLAHTTERLAAAQWTPAKRCTQGKAAAGFHDRFDAREGRAQILSMTPANVR